MMENKTTRNTDGSSTTDAEVDAAAYTIAQAFGVRTDVTLRVVDEFGVTAALLALEYTLDAMSNGQSFASPIAFMTSLLRKGIIQAEMVEEEYMDDAHRRLAFSAHHYDEEGYSDEAIAEAKRLAAVEWQAYYAEEEKRRASAVSRGAGQPRDSHSRQAARR
jgi:hypothetical protein